MLAACHGWHATSRKQSQPMRRRANMTTATKFFSLVILSILPLGVSGRAADPVNEAPQVRFINPQDGQTFVAPTVVRLMAYAQDREDGYHVKVEFFEGTNSLGVGTFVPSLCPAPYCPNFALTWSNVTAGAYTLAAVASDSAGASTKSDPMHVQVVGLQQQPIVTIFARDATASEQSPLVDAAPDTATFVVHRTGGGFDNTLNRSFRIGRP